MVLKYIRIGLILKIFLFGNVINVVILLVVTTKNNDSKKPLGIIPSPRIKKARNEIHKILDPLWKNGKYTRTELYKMISIHIGYNYHTAEIRDIEIAKKVYLFLKFLNKN